MGRERSGSALLLIAVGALAVVMMPLVFEHKALACVPMPVLTVEPQGSGTVGSRVTVEGKLFIANAPVEIRWNGLDGPLLNEAVGPDISVEMVVPDAVVGLYSVVAFSRLPDGSVGYSSQASFQVIGGEESTGDLPTVQEQVETSTGLVDTEAASAPRRSIGEVVVAATGLVVLGGMGGVVLSRRQFRKRESVSVDG